MSKKVFRILVPEYTIEEKPDYVKIGKKVDAFIEQNFEDGKYVIRAIGHQDHPDLSLNELIDVIVEIGTDKYDEGKKSLFDDEFLMYEYDFHAGFVEIKNGKLLENSNDDYPTCFGDIIYHFYEHAPIDRGYAVRVDLLLVYDFDKLERGCFFWMRGEVLGGLQNVFGSLRIKVVKMRFWLGLSL